MSKCNVNIFIHEKHENLDNVDIKNTEIRKKDVKLKYFEYKP